MTPNDQDADPVHATLVAILQQLNRAESINEGQAADQTLELAELDRLLSRFWAVERGQVKIPLALGLLVRNKLVEAQLPGARDPASGGVPKAVYKITTDGKAYLVDAQKDSDRIA